MHKIKTRLAEKKDAEYIALLARITFTETFGHFFRDRQDLLNYYDSTFSVEKIERSISKSNNIYWISFIDRLPVGYAKLKLNSKSEFIEVNLADFVFMAHEGHYMPDSPACHSYSWRTNI